MNIVLSVKTAWHSLGANKKRSFMTMLGIIIGIAAVVIIFSLGKGAESLIFSQISSIGSDLIVVLPGAAEEKGPPASAMGITITSLKEEDINAIVKQIPEVLVATGYVRGQGSVSFKNKTVDTPFVGVNSDYLSIEDTDLDSGRFFTKEEDNGLNKVAVLGSEIAQELFDNVDPLGKRIKIKKQNFTVIGVMKKRGVSGFANQDRQIFIPLQTTQKIILGVDYISLARIKTIPHTDLNYISEMVKNVLRAQHNIKDKNDDDFSVRNMNQAQDLLGSLIGALSFFLAAIGAISLLVGGIGIMNIMLVSVNERISEIGLRKALGAKEKDISYQFLSEAVILTIVGALFGVLLGVIFSGAIAFLAKYLGYTWHFVITFNSVLYSTILSLFIGLIFGYYPAKKAASLNPIDALRYE